MYQAAIYLRLSRDDGQGESGSISAQRRLLQTYCQANGFPIVAEFVDDGWSGTSFERPGFAALLRAVESGAVNLVLTKDLSRLGRNYLSAGQYTELYFPAHNVRYIAVGDGYDSQRGEDDSVPFRHVVNEMYARDASRKIRSALQVRMLDGLYIGSYAPYGYRKDPQNHNHLLPDPETAPIVQELFALAAAGRSGSEIAGLFNNRRIPSPLAHRQGRTESAWRSAGVCRMLENSVYKGDLAQGKNRKVSFRSKVVRAQPKPLWIVVKQAHEPLVTPALFEQAQRRSAPCAVYCADCGSRMTLVRTRRKQDPYDLVCARYHAHGRAACSRHGVRLSAVLPYLGCGKVSVGQNGEIACRPDATQPDFPASHG
ncbi:MAG: recombinase family protein [Oscillospiraceae bacterium]|nr:recombinase family protein [Oscillospiraceae bacterium]